MPEQYTGEEPAQDGEEAAAPEFFGPELRPWVTGGILALAGLAIHFFTTDGGDDVPWRIAGAAFCFFGGLAAAFTLDREDPRESAIFAAGVGLVMGGVAFHAIDMGDRLAGSGFAYGAAVLATLLAVPLFQAGFHRHRFATPYAETHYHLWTDAVSGAGALLFAGLSWVLLWLLHSLLDLVGMDFIEQLLELGGFNWMWFGGTFGAALGVLRNNLKVIGALQSVVLLVLSLLAVPLALALVLFLVALAASGGTALWDATNSATPILLTCAAGCFIITNAIIRQDDAARSDNVVMQAAALVLAFGILPLAVFSAISMGIRIGQHGLAPERIWALIAIAVAVAYGLAYWTGLARGLLRGGLRGGLRGRLEGWSQHLRRANLNLAVGVCALALFLALPILNFGSISASNQLARLSSGKVSAADFDYTALRWDFGDPGRKALDRLAAGEGESARLAALAKAQSERRWRDMLGVEPGPNDLRFDFADAELQQAVRDGLQAEPWLCGDPCVVLDGGLIPDGRRHVVFVYIDNVRHHILPRADVSGATPFYVSPARPGEVTMETEVDIRPFTGRQVYVDGKPVGQPFD